MILVFFKGSKGQFYWVSNVYVHAQNDSLFYKCDLDQRRMGLIPKIW